MAATATAATATAAATAAAATAAAATAAAALTAPFARRVSMPKRARGRLLFLLTLRLPLSGFD
jgi:hypothetical protein